METIKIDVRPNRRYNFRHDLWIDWLGMDAWDDEACNYFDSLDENYYCYRLDFFDHSAISFSLAIERRDIWYYEFDRSRDVWLIAIPKSLVKTGRDAQKMARDYLVKYNDYINWRDESEDE